ncbi:hypothetical protein MAR_021687 [Mya arenaria]|uniref:Ig-like domain-containing protein n=1 Tax=Mya arenaria TaxID=6604 RepID=A0ABY7E8C9_MYAAR|nr:hypothetical protein MAR_021687 [Mya arenaria]
MAEDEEDYEKNPPDLPTLHFGSNSGPGIDGPLTLVVQLPFTLACTVSSKPPANYTWTGGVNVVQDPPESVSIRHESESGTVILSEFRVIEGNATKLYCSVQSQPASFVTWSGADIHSLGSTLAYSNTLKSQAGVLSCFAENNMKHGYQAVKGYASRNISLNVLHPPKLKHISRRNVLEGNMVLIQCLYAAGNPITTRSTITRTADGTSWSENSHTFQFDVSAFPYQNIITVNESERLLIICEVLSNPQSTIRLKENHKATILVERENVLEVEYVIQNTSCSDSAVYTCSAFNNYTAIERVPTNELQLLTQTFKTSELPKTEFYWFLTWKSNVCFDDGCISTARV